MPVDVLLRDTAARTAWPDDLTAAVAAVPTGVGAVLQWAAVATGVVPPPGEGRTIERWEVLATLGAHDLVTARVVEPHLDALAILREAGDPVDGASAATWGVWAAEGPGARLEAGRDGDGWTLTGRKPWCSLAGQVGHGLVTAWVGAEERALFAVDTAQPGFAVDATAWSPIGLADVKTATVTLDAVPATAVGGPGWYLRRDGFAWGGVGVAAVWYGGAVGLARRLADQCRRRPPDQVALMHLGAVDAAITAARTVLAASAEEIDAGRATGAAGEVLAARVRHVVAAASEEVLTRVAHALGPGPLAHEPDHARRVVDLQLYLRQHHAERDAAALGASLLAADGPPW